jgi:hypothetical protein
MNIRGRSSNQSNVNWKRFIPKPRSTIELNPFNNRLDSSRVQPATGLQRVDKSPETNMRKTPWATSGDISQQLTDNALGQVICLDLICDCQRPQAWDQSPMAANHPTNQSCMG